MEKYFELKKILKSKSLDAYIVPKHNMFFSTDVLPHEERLKYISNFSGSYGWAIIMSKNNLKSAIFSDGRYKLQIKKEVDKKLFDQFEGGIDKIVDYFIKNKNKCKNIGIDPFLISINDFKYLKSKLVDHGIRIIKISQNLIDLMWVKKPDVPDTNLILLPLKYSGEKHTNKILELIKIIRKYKSQAYLLFRPDCLSWLLNIRDHQLKYSPVVRGISIIEKSGKVHLFTEKIINKNFFKNYENIKLYKIKDLNQVLNKFNKCNLLIDPNVTPIKIMDLLNSNKIQCFEIKCPLMERKSIKNNIELQMSKKTHLIDGLAFLKFWHWLELNINNTNLTEENLSEKLFFFRSFGMDFKGNSFPTISAFGKNGAIIHYQFQENHSSKIKKNNLYLNDSGGQYLSGTTDVTRTLIFGKPTMEMKKYYTNVLKGHLAISNLTFPEGTKGRDIDVLARVNLWKSFGDYNHGTGHGVGHYLNVHEGPISISKSNDSIFREGMIISNEPGFYKNNEFGIRIENLEIVKKNSKSNNSKKYFNFETLTMVPYEKSLIKKNLLNVEEIFSINNYHKEVYKKLISFINPENKSLIRFLIRKTSIL